MEPMGESNRRVGSGWIGRPDEAAKDESVQVVFAHPITRSPDHPIF
jgi:hypothetical protein